MMAAAPPTRNVSKADLNLFLPIISPLTKPIARKVSPVKILEIKKTYSLFKLKTYGEIGTKPIITKEKKVAKEVFKASRIFWFSFDRSLKKFDEAMENPSASTLATPRMSTITGERAAPETPATMAKVVTVPSIEP